MDNRPKLTDPAEFALIKSIYFKDNRKALEVVDPIERNERMEAKSRFNKKSSR